MKGQWMEKQILDKNLVHKSLLDIVIKSPYCELYFSSYMLVQNFNLFQ